MSRLLRRASRRHLLRHPWQITLSLVGIALGVAVVVSVDLAAASAQRSFDLGYEAVAGRATHQVVAGPAGVPEELYHRIRVGLGLRASAPVVEESVRFVGVDGAPGRPLRVLGVDPFAEAPFRPYLGRGGGGGREGAAAAPRVDELLVRPGAAVLSRATADALGLVPGDRFRVAHGTSRPELELVGLVEAADRLSRQALGDLVLTDVASAQELFGWLGRLSRIDLILPGDDPGAAAAVAALLPPGVELSRSAARSRAADQMTRAFRLNLRALSLLALLCGAFLIFNTMTFSVVERRSLIGLLRAVGVTRRQVFAVVLAEAALLGLLGSALGLVLGTALGRGLVELVTQTIDDLYFRVGVGRLDLGPATLAKGLALGLGATLAATLAPAREAAAAPPRAALTRSELEGKARRGVPRASAMALLLAALGGGLMALPGTLPGGAGGAGLGTSFAGLFAVLVGAALLTPLATVLAGRLLAPPLGKVGGLLGRLAAGGVAAQLSRTGVAIAALMMAVAVTVGVALMTGSFRATVERWLAWSLPADLYVSLGASPGSRLLASRQTIDPELPERLAAVPGVARVNRLLRVTVPTGRGRSELLALGIDERSHGAFAFKEGAPPRAWPAFQRGEVVLVSEPWAFRHGLGVGDSLTFSTPTGPLALPIAGVFYDYASDRGTVVMAYERYVSAWGDRRLTALSLFVEPGTGPAAVAGRLRPLVAAEGLALRSSRELRQGSLAVFDRTFLITGVLRLLATLVAFVGVLSALMALQLERVRELGVLRALGLTRRQLFALTTAQTGVAGLVAGLLAVPVGILMAALMIFVINRRSFGWTMPLELDPLVLLQAVGLALAAALAAGLYPAWRMARTSPAEALREE